MVLLPKHFYKKKINYKRNFIFNYPSVNKKKRVLVKKRIINKLMNNFYIFKVIK